MLELVLNESHSTDDLKVVKCAESYITTDIFVLGLETDPSIDAFWSYSESL